MLLNQFGLFLLVFSTAASVYNLFNVLSEFDDLLTYPRDL
ncbi:putative membrane protein [Escherichia coli 95.0183]|nr:hypothetical protein ECFDA507_3574 [Escherichia coli FDA507]EKW26437.1 putative membrane protein [Escherichia coli 95.0183]